MDKQGELLTVHYSYPGFEAFTFVFTPSFVPNLFSYVYLPSNDLFELWCAGIFLLYPKQDLNQSLKLLS